MNSMDMLQENLRAADECRIGELTESDHALLKKVSEAINARMKVGCTGCRYCMPCPHNVDIPGTFAAYNRCAYDGKIRGLTDYLMCTVLRKDITSASNCVECGRCEAHCPQHIPIRRELKNARKELEGPIYQVARKVIRLVMKY